MAQHVINGECEGIGEDNQSRRLVAVRPPDQGVALGGWHHTGVEGRHRAGVPRPKGDGRALLHLPGAADDRLGGAAEQRAGAERGAHGGGHVLHGAHVGGGDEEHGQVGRRGIGTESVEHLADRFARGLRRKRVLGESGGEGHRCYSSTGGRSVSGTTVVWPASMRQWASIVP